MVKNIDLCLLCLTNYSKLKSILSKDSDGVIIDEKLNFFISKHVNIKTKGYILFICFPCLEKLNNVYNYKRLCIENINRLNGFIHKLKSTDEPCSNLLVTMIDKKNINNYKVACGNESNIDSITTKNCKIANPNEDETQAQEENIIRKGVLDEIKYEIVDEIVKEEPKDNRDINIKSELQIGAFLNDSIEDNPNEDETEHVQKSEDIREILEKENNKMEYTNISDNTENKNAQEEYVIKEDVLDKNEIKFEFVDVTVKEEPKDNFDIIDKKSELENDAFLNETDINKESTSKNSPSAHLITHTVSHTGEQPFKCNMCDKAYNLQSYLVRHKRTHSDTKPYKCDICDKAFKQKCHLDTHIRCHTGEKPYKCDVCDNAFKQKNQLEMHIRCHTGEKPYKCDVCDKAFSQKSSLTTHKRCHTGDKPYKCDVCDKAFSQTTNLTTHKRCHTGDRLYKCDVCDKAFIQQSQLVMHKLVHSKIKPYKCDTCDKAFYRSSHLKSHKRSHTGEKPYKCDVCDKEFNYKHNLQTHKRCHTGEKPYKCDVCDKGFSQLSSLTTHKRCHTGDKPHQ